MEVLVSWIGTADLLSVVESAPEVVKEKIRKKTKNRKPKDTGPLITLTSERIFDEIHLLCDWDDDIGSFFKEQLVKKSNTKGEVKVHFTTKLNPIRYEEIFRATDHFLEEVYRPLKSSDTLFIFLTSGTPAMAAIWVLLGKTKYSAKFLQTCNDDEVPDNKKSQKDKHVIDENIPINFTLERQNLSDNKGMFHLIEEGSQDGKEFQDIKGESDLLRLSKGLAKRAAIFDAPILLCGETGTGKELFARAIHDASPRKDAPYIALNCAAFPKELLESELFGYKKGAFTGAVKDKDGAFKLASQGTLFLDEIGECSLDLQAKLLRALQPKKDSDSLTCLTIHPIGAKEDIEVDVRVIAATNRDLRQMIRDKQFREDLYYRLAVIPIPLPPLRERKGDLEILANSFLEDLNILYEKHNPQYKCKKFSSGTLNFIKSQEWPGNVRELHNAIRYAVVMGDGTEITPDDIKAAINHGPHTPSIVDNVSLGEGFVLGNFLINIEVELIEKALKETKGKITQAAKILGFEQYQNLSTRLKKYNISAEDFK